MGMKTITNASKIIYIIASYLFLLMKLKTEISDFSFLSNTGENSLEGVLGRGNKEEPGEAL